MEKMGSRYGIVSHESPLLTLLNSSGWSLLTASSSTNIPSRHDKVVASHGNYPSVKVVGLKAVSCNILLQASWAWRPCNITPALLREPNVNITIVCWLVKRDIELFTKPFCMYFPYPPIILFQMLMKPFLILRGLSPLLHI